MATNNHSTLMGLSCNTLEGHVATTKYINQFLQEHKFPELDHLMEENVEGKSLSNLFENIGIWFYSTRFRNHQNTWLWDSSKEEKLKRVKEVFKWKFPTHKVFPPSQHNCFSEMKGWFKKYCKHCWFKDTDVFRVRKSEPLYRDLSLNKTAVRTNYWGKYFVCWEFSLKNFFHSLNTSVSLNQHTL